MSARRISPLSEALDALYRQRGNIEKKIKMLLEAEELMENVVGWCDAEGE